MESGENNLVNCFLGKQPMNNDRYNYYDYRSRRNDGVGEDNAH